MEKMFVIEREIFYADRTTSFGYLIRHEGSKKSFEMPHNMMDWVDKNFGLVMPVVFKGSAIVLQENTFEDYLANRKQRLIGNGKCAV